MEFNPKFFNGFILVFKKNFVKYNRTIVKAIELIINRIMWFNPIKQKIFELNKYPQQMVIQKAKNRTIFDVEKLAPEKGIKTLLL